MTLEEKLKTKSKTIYGVTLGEPYWKKEHQVIELEAALSIIQQEIESACKKQIKLKDLIFIYNSGYLKGHHDTVESGYADLRSSELDNYHYEEVTELMEENSIKLPPSPKESE